MWWLKWDRKGERARVKGSRLAANKSSELSSPYESNSSPSRSGRRESWREVASCLRAFQVTPIQLAQHERNKADNSF